MLPSTQSKMATGARVDCTQNASAESCFPMAYNVTGLETADEKLSPAADAEIANLYFGLLGVAGAVVCMFGLVGNLLNIGVLSTTVRRTRTPTYHILLALAVSDSMIMLIYASFALTFFARHPPIIRPYQIPPDANAAMVLLYHTWYMAINAFVCASNWYVVAVTFFRFLAVYFPMKVSIWCTLKRVRLVIIAVIILSIAVAIPDMLTVELYVDAGGHVRFNDTDLFHSPTFGRVYYTSQTVLLHLLPFVVNIVLVSVLIRTLFNSQRGLRNSVNVKNARSREVDQKRVSVMLVVMVLFSLVTTLPSMVYRALRDFGGPREENEDSATFITLRGACDIVELFNYASNFYLYIVSNPSYRRQFLRATSCNRRPRSGSVTQYTLVNEEQRDRAAAVRQVSANARSRSRSRSAGSANGRDWENDWGCLCSSLDQALTGSSPQGQHFLPQHDREAGGFEGHPALIKALPKFACGSYRNSPCPVRE